MGLILVLLFTAGVTTLTFKDSAPAKKTSLEMERAVLAAEKGKQ